MYNSSTLGHNQVTVCARFLTNRFTDEAYHGVFGWGSKAIVSVWDPNLGLIAGASLGGLHQFPVWDMMVWNHVCIMLDSVTENMRVVMNGKTTLEANLEADISILDHNLTLMGYLTPSGYAFSLFGRMTDVNMWSRSMTDEDAVSWTRCRRMEGGDLVDWRTATWEARGLQEVQVEREEVCRVKQERLLVSHVKRDFDGTLRLARMLGGKMAVTDSQQAAEEMVKLLEPVKEVCTDIYTGFTERKEKGKWLNIYTQEKLTWKN